MSIIPNGVPIQTEPDDYYDGGSDIILTREPWDSDYRNVMGWSAAERDSYFRRRVADAQPGSSDVYQGRVFRDMSYLPFGRPIRLDLPFNVAQSYNYLVANTRSGPRDIKRTYYYFIVGVEYESPDTTLVNLQLDVWNTFRDQVSIGRCWIERGHIGVADKMGTTDQHADFGRDLLSIPEGLDTGGTYAITRNQASSLIKDQFLVMVTTTTRLDDPSTIDNPKPQAAAGSKLELGVDSAEILIFDSLDEYHKMLNFIKDKPWTAQGITSVTALPDSFLDWFKNNGAVKTSYGESSGGYSFWRGAAWTAKAKDPNERVKIENFRDLFYIPNRYRHLHKLKTFPYACLEITNLLGQSMVVQPENVYDTTLKLNEVSTLNPSNPRVSLYVANNNATPKSQPGDFMPNADGGVHDSGEGLNAAITLDNFPRFTILSNAGLMYMATNAHSLAQSRGQAGWDQQKALAGNSMAYNQASQNMQTAETLNDINKTAMSQSAHLANFTGALQAGSNAINSLGSGNVAGALTAGSDYLIQMNNTNQQYAIDTERMNSALTSQNYNAAYMRDTNKQYADMTAKGDYQYAISAINAKVQDSQVVAPTVHGATGGDALAFLYRMVGVLVRWKQLPPAAMRLVGEYFLQYGYAIQMWATPPQDLHCMTKFTYWKMKESHVFSRGCPEEHRMTIRGILEKGVTVWRNVADIGIIDPAENEPVPNNYLTIWNWGDQW